jgi:hypothetical protein
MRKTHIDGKGANAYMLADVAIFDTIALSAP